MSASKVNIVRLGDYITQRREKNKDYDVPIRGVTREGFIAPKQDGDLSMYNVFYKYDFVFNPARMEINSIALNLEWEKAICSSLYEVFYVNDTNMLLPEYLNLFLKRDEFARYCWYDAIGSARNYYRVYNLAEVRIPLPDIEVQRELVGVYEGLKRLAEENEAMLDPLAHACEAFIINCKKNYPTQALGEYIEEVNERNSNGIYDESRLYGVKNDGSFIHSIADKTDLDLSKYKVVSKGDFCYTLRIIIGSIALYQEETPCVVSTSYTIFRLKNEQKLLSAFLNIIFRRKEFHRYAKVNSWGSAKDNFSFADLCAVQIPIPPIEVQEKIVALYRCYEECKRIATEAREQLKTICPALVQRGKQA